MALNDLLGLLEKFKTEVDGATLEQSFSKEIWQLRKEIVSHFDRTKFATQSERDEKWFDFQAIVFDLKEKQEAFTRSQHEFADLCTEKVNELKVIVEQEKIAPYLDKEGFIALRSRVAATFDFIKQNNWPDKDRRVQLWNIFNQIRESIKDLENIYFAKVREERAKHAEVSAKMTESLVALLESSCNNESLKVILGFAQSFKEKWLEQFPELPVFGWIHDENLHPESKPLKVKSDTLREIRRVISDYKDLFTKDDKQKIFNYLDVAQPNLNKEWDLYRLQVQQKQEAWENKKKEKEQKRLDWEKKQNEFLDNLYIRQEKVMLLKEKLEKRLSGQADFVFVLENRHKNNQAFYKKTEESLVELQDKYEASKPGSYRDKIAGWIEEKEQKINEIKEELDGTEEKLKLIKEDLTVLPQRIKELTEALVDIEKKIIEVKQNLESVQHEA